jgi:hypothetical protein
MRTRQLSLFFTFHTSIKISYLSYNICFFLLYALDRFDLFDRSRKLE